MGKRYWIIGMSYGYVGTDSTEEIDLYDYEEPEVVDEMSDKEAEKIAFEVAWDTAVERVDSWAEPDESKN